MAPLCAIMFVIVGHMFKRVIFISSLILSKLLFVLFFYRVSPILLELRGVYFGEYISIHPFVVHDTKYMLDKNFHSTGAICKEGF